MAYVQVDLVRRHCFPVYWNGENRRVLRGHWFACNGGLDWHPIREDVSEQLEYAYRCQVLLSSLYNVTLFILKTTASDSLVFVFCFLFCGYLVTEE